MDIWTLIPQSQTQLNHLKVSKNCHVPTVAHSKYTAVVQDVDEGVPSPKCPASAEHKLRLDDIKVEYHPKSGCPIAIYSFEEFTQRPKPLQAEPDSEPWKLFRTWLDFELASLMLKARMNERQSAALISLIHQCVEEPKSFTITNVKDLKKMWEHARTTCATGVSYCT